MSASPQIEPDAETQPNATKHRKPKKRRINEAVNETTIPTANEEAEDIDAKTRSLRGAIAVQACEACRQKKARCDEGLPKCSVCQRAGVECVYSERRVTKKDQTLRDAINSIRRLEAKIESLTDVVQQGFKGDATAHSAAVNSQSEHRHAVDTPLTIVSNGGIDIPEHHKISFSQHEVLHWPAVSSVLPEEILLEIARLPRNYAVELERSRSPLSSETALFMNTAHEWLNDLPIRVIRTLTDAFFATFNGLFPVLDRQHFFSSTLGSALEAEFDYSVESTTVLLVMALGCLAIEGHREGDYPLRRDQAGHNGFQPPDWYAAILGEQFPGLSFFNEARKRMSFRNGSNNLFNCQVYLLCAFYYTQIIRPIDSYLMLLQAASCSLMTLTCSEPIDFKTWEGDMESRVYWCCLMYESILIQELGLPKSGLTEYESAVPLPTFKPFSSIDAINGVQEAVNSEDAFFHYHFLAQAANRIMLTRIANSHYSYDDEGDLPSRRIHTELLHQIAQWKESLPTPLRFGPEPMSSHPQDPGSALAEALLRSRYLVLHFHLGRPYLYKALHHPARLTDYDLDVCRATWEAAMHWPMLTGICRRMKSVMLLKFAYACQLFGQVMMMWSFATAKDERLTRTLPAGWKEWRVEMLEFLGYAAMYSPAVAKDVDLLRHLKWEET